MFFFACGDGDGTRAPDISFNQKYSNVTVRLVQNYVLLSGILYTLQLSDCRKCYLQVSLRYKTIKLFKILLFNFF